MLRAGSIILTLWTGFKLSLSLGVLFMLLVFAKNSPALLLLYGDAQGKGLDPRALATINALAIAALSLLSLAVIWAALVKRAEWAFWSLASALLFLEVVRWLGESVYYHQETALVDAATLLPTIAVSFAQRWAFLANHHELA